MSELTRQRLHSLDILYDNQLRGNENGCHYVLLMESIVKLGNLEDNLVQQKSEKVGALLTRRN